MGSDAVKGPETAAAASGQPSPDSCTSPSQHSSQSGSGRAERTGADALAKASLEASSAKAGSGSGSGGGSAGAGAGAGSGSMRRVGSGAALMGLRKNGSYQSLAASDGTAPPVDTVLTTKVRAHHTLRARSCFCGTAGRLCACPAASIGSCWC